MQYSTEIRKRIDEALRSLIGIAERVDGYDDWKRIPPIPKLELTREGDWDLPEKEQNTAKNIRRFTGLRFVGKTRADYDRYRDVLKPIAYDSQKEYNARKRATPATKEKEMEKRHLNGNEIAIDRDKLERAAHANGYKSLAELCRAAFVEKRKEGVMVSDNYLTERLRKNGTIPEEGVNVLCEHLSVPRNAISQTSDPVQTSLDLDRANTEQEGEFRFNARMSVEMGEYLKQKAWLLHKSEERLAEDRDFGESLLQCAAGILDKFCRGMYGEGLSTTSTSYKNYINLYNSAATKFIQEYVVATARKRKLTPEQMVSTDKNLESLGPVVTEGNMLDLDIPDCIRGTDEFDWISRNWVLKGDIING